MDNGLSSGVKHGKMIKHLRRWLSIDGCFRVVTSKYFGLAYYRPRLDDTEPQSSVLETAI